MNTEHFRYLIVGAGPGGLQMAYFLQRAGLEYCILERDNKAGSFFATQPVHRKLISINKKYNYFEEPEFNWRHDWNSLLSDDPSLRITEYTDELFPHADVLFQYLQDYARRLKLQIRYDTEVKKISRDETGGFHLKVADGGTFTCDVLLMGLGAVQSSMPEEIEGIEHTTPYSAQQTDLEFYKNKRVAVLGGGNSAFETADHIAGVAAHVHVMLKEPLKMAWDTHFVGDLRAVNNNLLDMYQLKSLHAVLNPRIRKITKTSHGTLRTHHEYDYPDSDPPGTLKLNREYDAIINCTGFQWVNPALFDASCMPDTKEMGKYPLLGPTWESANVPGMYFIGGAMQSIDRISASGFIHGYRYNIRSLFHLLQERYEDVPYPSETFRPFDWNAFLNGMYERFSISAALFQLFGFLSDVLVFDEDLAGATMYRELPKGHVSSRIPEDRHALVFTLEFGFHKHKGSSIEFLGPSDPNDTQCAAFLHPVIRHHFNGKTDTFHFGDSLLARWDRPHDDGGAVISYHYHFQKWVRDQTGLDIELPEVDPQRAGAYHPWTPEEVEAWKNTQAMKKSESPPCQGGKAQRLS